MPVNLPSYDFAHPARDVASMQRGRLRSRKLAAGRLGQCTRAPRSRDGAAPKPLSGDPRPRAGDSSRCEPTGEVTGPPLTTAPPARAKADAHPREPACRPHRPPQRRAPLQNCFCQVPPRPPVARAWTPFRGVVAPLIPAGDVGLQAGTNPAVTMQARLYAWGGRGSEWLRSGHLQARFDDRFDPLGTRSTAISPSPWSDEDRAAEALGLSAGQTFTWSALLDASGLSAVSHEPSRRRPCGPSRSPRRAPRSVARCRIRHLPPRAARSGSVKPGSSLAPGPPQIWEIELYRVDGSVARRLARFPRVPLPQGEFVPASCAGRRGRGWDS